MVEAAAAVAAHFWRGGSRELFGQPGQLSCEHAQFGDRPLGVAQLAVDQPGQPGTYRRAGAVCAQRDQFGDLREPQAEPLGLADKAQQVGVGVAVAAVTAGSRPGASSPTVS